MNSTRSSYSTDEAMKNIWLSLKDDFTKVLGPVGKDAVRFMQSNDIPSFRKCSWPSFLNLDPYRAKCLIQVEKFLNSGKCSHSG